MYEVMEVPGFICGKRQEMLPEAIGRCFHLLSEETLGVSARGTGLGGTIAVGGQCQINSVSLWSFTLLGSGMGQG